MGAMAAQTADRLVVAGRIKYLRGREPGEMEEIWRAGAAEAGVVSVDESPDELAGLIQLLDATDPPLPDGSAVAVCALEMRAEMALEVERRGGAEMTPAEVAQRVGSRG
jgi:cyanophycin synthetase